MIHFLMRLLILATVGWLCLPVWSGTFIGATTPTNRFLIPTNAAAVFNSMLGENQNPEVQLVTSGKTYLLKPYLDAGSGHTPRALAGPAELVFRDPVVVNYHLVYGQAIQTMIIPSGVELRLVIPEEKRLKLLQALTSDYVERIKVERGTTAVNVHVEGGEEFTGPLSITATNAMASGYSVVWSYLLTDDFLRLPDVDLLQGPTGDFEIAVERSADLTNWFPAVIDRMHSVQREFFRLRLSR